MEKEHLGVAIIGCGLIGRKRANALGKARLVCCADIDKQRAQNLAGFYANARSTDDWREAIQRPEVKIVFAATPNDMLPVIALEAVKLGKHVLVEKPAARHSSELDEVISTANKTGALVRVGFNHRYHPSLQKAKQLVDSGVCGELMFMRGRYGHGGRLGYEQEWRADPRVSGGGELLDQGVHLIDLSRWFLGDFPHVAGRAQTYFWNMPVDDNGFMILQTAKRQTAFLHVSWTEWKNMFSLEIYGRDAKLQIDGLGGSYGQEKLTYYKMLPQMGPPEMTVWEYPAEDASWQVEFNEFLEDIRLNRQPKPGLEDAKAALKIVESIYKESGYDHHS